MSRSVDRSVSDDIVLPYVWQQAKQTVKPIVQATLRPIEVSVAIIYARIILILTLGLATMLVCLGAKSAENERGSLAGVGIFDTLFIAAEGRFSVKGDLYLENTSVIGEGMLSLDGDSIQQIVSHSSQLMNLYITNPDEVKLQGELLISESLTIEAGTFDATQAQLLLTDSTQMTLLAGAKIMKRPDVLASLPLAGNVFSRTVFAPDAVLPSFNYLWDASDRLEWVRYQVIWQQGGMASLNTASPPPESGGRC